MKHIPTLLVLLICLSAPAITDAASAATDIEARKREVLQTEQKRVDALKRDDYAALARILSDDLTYYHSTGAADNKVQYIESLTSGRLKYKNLEHEGQVVRIYGDTAVLTGTSKVKVNSAGKDNELTLRFTIVYVRQNGTWQMVAWQSTRLTP